MKKVSKKKVKKETNACDCGTGSKSGCGGCGGCGYILGIIGAATYYISTAVGFWAGVLGLLKALVWPAFLVFEILKFVVA